VLQLSYCLDVILYGVFIIFKIILLQQNLETVLIMAKVVPHKSPFRSSIWPSKSRRIFSHSYGFYATQSAKYQPSLPYVKQDC